MGFSCADSFDALRGLGGPNYFHGKTEMFLEMFFMGLTFALSMVQKQWQVKPGVPAILTCGDITLSQRSQAQEPDAV